MRSDGRKRAATSDSAALTGAASTDDVARTAAARRLLVPRSGSESLDHLCALALPLLGAGLCQLTVLTEPGVVVSRVGAVPPSRDPGSRRPCPT